MSPSATPATQSRAASQATNGDQARHQTQPSVTSTTSATQNEGGCRQVPLLPCETTVDVTKCHACHAKWRGGAAARATNGDQARHQTQPSVICTTPATQNEGGRRQAPPLPRKATVDVTKCHACHAKWHGVAGDQRGPPATQNDGGCRQVPRLPRKVERRHGQPTWTKRVTRPAKRHKYHPCHAKQRWMSPSATPATQSGAAASRATNGDQAHHQTQPSVISTTPARQNEGGCRQDRQVPRLPRETTVDVAK